MKNIVVVCASFHEEHVKKMLNHVETEIKDKNLEITHIQWVPGSFELPLAMNRLLSRTDIAAGICLGIIEKGETQHGEAIGNALMKSLLDIQINQNKPMLGVIGQDRASPIILNEKTCQRRGICNLRIVVKKSILWGIGRL